jgi:glycosyltransferase involved in cell wall biosynthesis
VSARPRVTIDARSWFTRGGTGRYARSLVRALLPVAAGRVDLTVLLSKRHETVEAGIPPLPHVTVVRSRADWLDFDDEAAHLEADVQGDLLHSLTGHWVSTRIPSLVTVHDLTPIVLALPADDPLTVQCWRLVANVVQARACLTDSAATARDLARLVPGAPRGTVVPLAADAVFDPRSVDLRRLQPHGLSADRFWLAAALAAPYKNLDGLLEAYRASGVGDPLVIAGRPSVSSGTVEDRIRALDLFGRVRLVGMVDDETLATLYATCRGFVRPSLYEGFGLPLLEAMQCGAACLSSDRGSLPEVGGDAVVYFDPAQPDACADALARVNRDDALRRRLKDRALARASGFTWGMVAEATMLAYCEAWRA